MGRLYSGLTYTEHQLGRLVYHKAVGFFSSSARTKKQSKNRVTHQLYAEGDKHENNSPIDIANQ